MSGLEGAKANPILPTSPFGNPFFSLVHVTPASTDLYIADSGPPSILEYTLRSL